MVTAILQATAALLRARAQASLHPPLVQLLDPVELALRQGQATKLQAVAAQLEAEAESLAAEAESLAAEATLAAIAALSRPVKREFRPLTHCAEKANVSSGKP
jgi:transcriptional antiterminator Rof (Rho-off)